MIIQIISTLIALIIYNIIKKLIKFIFIKKNKFKSQEVLNLLSDVFPIDKDFWGDK